MSVDNSSLLNIVIVHDILEDVNMNSQDDMDPYAIFIVFWSEISRSTNCLIYI